jgi:hypothetical protein
MPGIDAGIFFFFHFMTALKTLAIYETNDTYMVTPESSICNKTKQIEEFVKDVTERGI